MEGIEKAEELPAPTNSNLYEASPQETQHLAQLPQSLGEALDLAQASQLVQRVLPQSIRDKYFELKRAEAARITSPEDRAQQEQDLYFHRL